MKIEINQHQYAALTIGTNMSDCVRFMIEIYTTSNLNSNALKDEFKTFVVTESSVHSAQSDLLASKPIKV